MCYQYYWAYFEMNTIRGYFMLSNVSYHILGVYLHFIIFYVIFGQNMSNWTLHGDHNLMNPNSSAFRFELQQENVVLTDLCDIFAIQSDPKIHIFEILRDFITWFFRFLVVLPPPFWLHYTYIFIILKT